jgi:hypothetical protein
MATEAKKELTAIDQEVGAAFIASGIGSAMLGLLVVLAEISTPIKDGLTWFSPVGALSGKAGVSVIVFALSWVILFFVFKKRPIELRTSFITTLVLVAIGLLLTFPPVFEFVVHLFVA